MNTYRTQKSRESKVIISKGPIGQTFKIIEAKWNFFCV